jgi:hypothetical protein
MENTNIKRISELEKEKGYGNEATSTLERKFDELQ